MNRPQGREWFCLVQCPETVLRVKERLLIQMDKNRLILILSRELGPLDP